MLGSDGAMATASRPQGPLGRPLVPSAFNSFQLVPPSIVTKRPLPDTASAFSPPERKVQPLRRKSHRPAISFLGSLGSKASVEQPVERLGPLRISAQVLPPSAVL